MNIRSVRLILDDGVYAYGESESERGCDSYERSIESVAQCVSAYDLLARQSKRGDEVSQIVLHRFGRQREDNQVDGPRQVIGRGQKHKPESLLFGKRDKSLDPKSQQLRPL